jgi:hypothetical protein
MEGSKTLRVDSANMQRFCRIGVRQPITFTLIATMIATVGFFANATLVGATNPASSPSTWGAAKEVPGLSSLNLSYAYVNSISCATAGNCAAGGSYASEVDPFHSAPLGFVVDETNGIWGKAQEVPGLGALTVFGPFGGSYVTSVSCAAAGACAAVGTYTDAQGAIQDFVVDESGGTWGTAEEVPGLGALNVGGRALIQSVSCGAVGDCAAAGAYWSSTVPGSWQGLVVDELNGTWGTATVVPGPPGAVTASLSQVSCAAADDCAAVGSYKDAKSAYQGFVVEESGGTWGTAKDVPGLSALNAGGDASAGTISCAAAGDCSAGGRYKDDIGAYQGFVVDESSGTWGTAREVPGLGALNDGKNAVVLAVSCAVAGACAGGGSFDTDPNHPQGFVVDETDGSWGKAKVVPGLGSLNVGRDAEIQSISCGAAGNCAASGLYNGAGDTASGFVVNERNATWGRAEEVPGLGRIIPTSDSRVTSISCASADHCSAGGYYNLSHVDGSQGFVASDPGTPGFCSPTGRLTAAVVSHELSNGSVLYRVVYTNRGPSVCELAGIPGALGYTTNGHVPVGPPATRTAAKDRGAAIYLEPLVGKAESTFVIRMSLAMRSKSCHAELIDRVIIRPMGVPQMMVSINNPDTTERLVCRGLRNEAIYGFGSTSQPLT